MAVQSITEAFAEWAKEASPKQLEEFAEEILIDLSQLEGEDYFGTEGLNKRFA